MMLVVALPKSEAMNSKPHTHTRLCCVLQAPVSCKHPCLSALCPAEAVVAAAHCLPGFAPFLSLRSLRPLLFTPFPFQVLDDDVVFLHQQEVEAVKRGLAEQPIGKVGLPCVSWLWQGNFTVSSAPG